MGSIGHPCRTIQGSARYMSLMTVQALRELSVMRLREVSVMRPGNNPCSTVQALREVVFDQAVLLLPCWTNNHCPRLGLNVVIKHYWHSFPPGRQAMLPLSCAPARLFGSREQHFSAGVC